MIARSILVLLMIKGVHSFVGPFSRTRSCSETALQKEHQTQLSAVLIQPAVLACAKHASVVLGAGILSGYHLRLANNEKNGRPSWRTTQADTRQAWSKFVRETEGWLYAVQTLRNAITANTFLATTVLSLLVFISGRLWELVRGGQHGRKLTVQFMCVALFMLKSAYEFLQSARLMTHAGFMFPVVKGDKVDNIMRKSQLSQWSGLRWLYLSLGAIIWTIAGDYAFLLISLLLTYFFRKIDTVPTGVDVVASSPNAISSLYSSSLTVAGE